MNVEGYIYIVNNPLFPGYVKIGRTKNVEKRLKKLGTGVPRPYNVLHYELVINASEVETKLHHAFSIYRKDGEWFKTKNIEKIKEKIKSIQKDIRKQYEIPYGQTLKEKYESICSDVGVGGYSGIELEEYLKYFSKLDANKVDEAIRIHAESLLDFHPSIDDCY